MAKICNNCGRPVDDNAAFCTTCGARFAPPAPTQQPPMAPQYGQPHMAPNGYAPAQQPPMPPQGGYAPVQQPPMAPNGYAPAPGQPPMAPQYGAPVAPAPKKKPNFVKLGILAGSIVAAILVVVLAISLIFPSPKAVTKKLMKAIEKGDAATIIEAYPDFMWEDDSDKDEYIDDLQEEFDDMEIEDFKYEIKDVKDLSKSEIKEYEAWFELYEAFYDDFDADNITDYQKVKVKVTGELDGEDYSETFEIIYIKYKGQWKVLSGLGF